jgi:pimeloyl-ACP methyl ester carboxylesterase
VLGGCTANLQGPVLLLFKLQIAMAGLIAPAKLKAQLEKRIRKEYEAGPAILAGGLSPESYLAAVEEIRKVDFRSVLASITVPLFLVNGSRDIAHVVCERGARAANPRAELRRFPGVGHGVTLTRPAAFSALVREFVTLTNDN